MNNTDFAAKKFFDAIRNGLSEEEAFNQQVFENKTVRDVCKEAFYEEVFNKTVKEMSESKASLGKLYSEEAQKVIALFFKSTDNAWATRKEIEDFMDYIFGTTKNSFWGHIQRMHRKYGWLEHDEVNHCYRLSEKWFEQQ